MGEMPGWSKAKAIETIEIALEGVEILEPSRERSICITKLEEAIMWLKK